MTTASPASAPPPQRPFQFTLRQLAVVTLLISLPLALVVQLEATGVGICGTALGSLLLFRGWQLRSRLRFYLGAIVIWFGVVWLLLPAVSTPRWVWRRWACQNNLKAIGLALQDYHDDYGCFPPAYIPDANGQPMHSWRVLILPYLDEGQLYAVYDFSEPWNGPNNRKLALRVPREYQCLSDLSQSPRTPYTSYLAVTGLGTVWPGQQPVTLQQIEDGTQRTLLVVEVHNSGIEWMEPRDLDIANMASSINARQGYGIRSSHSSHGDVGRGEFAQALYCDGSVRPLTNATRYPSLRAALTIAGGEKVADSDY